MHNTVLVSPRRTWVKDIPNEHIHWVEKSLYLASRTALYFGSYKLITALRSWSSYLKAIQFASIAMQNRAALVLITLNSSYLNIFLSLH
jgi:hypothetical protein